MNEERYTKAFRRQITKLILKHAQSGMSISLLGLPGIGKTDFINYVIETCNRDSGCVLCFQIDANDLTQLSDLDFFKNLLSLLTDYLHTIKGSSQKVLSHITVAESRISSDEPIVLFNTIKKTLEIILESSPANVSFFIDGISKLRDLPTSFFNSLRALRTVDKFRVSYVFIDDYNLPEYFDPDRVGDLYDLLTAHVTWLPLPSEEEATRITGNCEKLLELTLTEEQRKQVFALTKGHASLTKYLIHYIQEEKIEKIDPTEAVKDLSIKARVEKILKMFSPEQKEIIRKIATQKRIRTDPLFSTENATVIFDSQLAAVNPETDTVELFSPLITAYVKRKTESIPTKPARTTDDHNTSHHAIAIRKGLVFINNRPLDQDLTQAEFGILQHLTQNYETIVTRDKIAEILWGNQSVEKYSDWAIDRTISRLRKKLGDNAYRPQYLKTLRGRGFKITDP